MADGGIGIGDVLLMIVSFLTSLSVVLIFIVIGWYIVWVAFLSRFKLMRELLSVNDDEVTKDKAATPKDPKTSSLSSSASSSSATRRTRQRTTPLT